MNLQSLPTEDTLCYSAQLLAALRLARDHPKQIDLSGEPQKFIYVLVTGTFANVRRLATEVNVIARALTSSHSTFQRIPFYYNNIKSRLRRRGLRCIQLKLKSESTVRVNAARIYAQVSPFFETLDGSKFIFLCHSKGGLDLTSALAKYPDLKQHTAMGIMLFSPLAGCVVAEHVYNSKRNFCGVMYKSLLWGADWKCVRILLSSMAFVHATNATNLLLNVTFSSET
jgi:hypothetical protein